MIIANVLFLLSLTVYVKENSSTDSAKTVIENALWQTTVTIFYDPEYRKISYPGGDIPIEKGVCTDVIVRAFRSVNIDLQKLIHEDMVVNFSKYPNIWKLSKPDRNIDHRRVPNIMTWLNRKGKKVPITDIASDYLPGDVVTWKLPGNLDHIGIVVNVRVKNTNRFAVVHNIGNGAKCEDVIFLYAITGHFRYF